MKKAEGRGFPVVDVDSHVYEPAAIWDRYVPREDQAAARTAFWHELDDAGNSITVLNGAPARGLNRSKIVRQAIWRPGMTPEEIGRLAPDVFHPLNPGAFEPEARLADMDAMGVDQAVLVPTLFAEYFPFVENPYAAAVLARAYNDWILDFCEAAPTRLHPVAILPLPNLLLARRELDRVAERGFKAVFVRPMFYTGDIPELQGPLAQAMAMTLLAGGPGGPANRRGVFVDHPHFEPLWRQIDELGLVACIHPSSGTASPEGSCQGPFLERVAQRLKIGHNVAESVAYLQDMGLFLTAICSHGLMEDFPTLRLALLHSGATMIPLVLEKAETYLWIGSELIPQQLVRPVSLEPAEVFRLHPLITSFDGWESPVAETVGVFREKAAWGSRYPQHDASSPVDAIAMLEEQGADEATVRRLMGANALALFGLKAAAPASPPS